MVDKERTRGNGTNQALQGSAKEQQNICFNVVVDMPSLRKPVTHTTLRAKHFTCTIAP